MSERDAWLDGQLRALRQLDNVERAHLLYWQGDDAIVLVAFGAPPDWALADDDDDDDDDEDHEDHELKLTVDAEYLATMTMAIRLPPELRVSA